MASRLIDRRLAKMVEPFRSGARPLAASMRHDLVRANARGKPPVVAFIDRVQTTWPALRITDNVKVVAGMIVAEALAPEFRRGSRKHAPRESCLTWGTTFVPTPATKPAADFPGSSLDNDGVFELAREMLERAAETFASIKAGKPFDQTHRNYLRSAITALQAANADPL
jgi:hypothetical protein